MAADQDQGQEKTEEPSDKRLEQFKDEGQIPRTPELGVLMIVATGMTMLSYFGSGLGVGFAKALRAAFIYDRHEGISSLRGWVELYATPVMKIVIIFAITLLIVSIISSFFQTGFHMSWKRVKPKFDCFNPIAGFKQVVSPKMLIQFIKNFAKVGAIGFIVYSELKTRINDLILMSSVPVVEAMRWCAAMLSTIVLKVVIFLAILAALDYLHQWYSIRKRMMMTRQELKDEYKESQLPEHVRAKVRQVANERAKRTIQKEVPTADVIVTNPTHFAVALRYNRFVDSAPRVVAKGQDLLAATIRDVAKKNNVPIYEYPELARKLYRTVKVGQTVPGDLYEGVARVLAFVYRMHQQRKVVRA